MQDIHVAGASHALSFLFQSGHRTCFACLALPCFPCILRLSRCLMRLVYTTTVWILGHVYQTGWSLGSTQWVPYMPKRAHLHASSLCPFAHLFHTPSPPHPGMIPTPRRLLTSAASCLAMVTSPSRAQPTTWWASATPSSSCRRCGTTTSEHAPSGNPHKRTHTRPCTYEYPVHPLTHNCYLQQVIAAALHLLPRPCLLMVSTGRLWYHHSIACGVWRCCQSWRDRDGGSHDMPSLIAAVQAQEVETATVTLFHPLMCILHTCLILYSMCAFHSKPCFLAMQQTGLLSH